jgi:hypothetical protein
MHLQWRTATKLRGFLPAQHFTLDCIQKLANDMKPSEKSNQQQLRAAKQWLAGCS